jgi:hypothetical protein
MPHIFPRRFLRTRDILDPKGFNDDLHPVSNLLSGRLDRTNFDSGALRTNLRPHPDSATPEVVGPSVAEGAYFNVYSDSIESRYRFYTIPAAANRHPPNFVELDGVTFRDDDIDGSNPNAKPYVVPNHGGWTAVENADLSATQQLNFTTGRSKVWISAYAQYIWQGFYENKPPWIPAHRRYRDMTSWCSLPELGYSFRIPGEDSSSNSTLLRERAVLNHLGPSRSWEYIGGVDEENVTSSLFDVAADFAFPLNEWGTVHERRSPSSNGCHHISRGVYPCLVQFALRVDGKIIEETITGKNLPFEESNHGLSVTDSIRKKDADEVDGDFEDLKDLLPGFANQSYQFGQRSIATSSSYGDRGDSRPGQKVRSSRAVAYGPEVMPVRLGAVVDVSPGAHTIELVVRRLQRKSKNFGPGDFVGVFSRRLLAFDLPIKPVRQESGEVLIGSNTQMQNPSIQAFKTETKIHDKNLARPREVLADQISEIDSKYIDDNVFSNEFLPSKVKYSQTVSLKPGFVSKTYTGEFASSETSTTIGSTAIFPGFTNTDKLNSVVSNPNDGWPDVGDPGLTSSDTVNNSGWFMLQEPDEDQLRIVPSETVVRPNEKVILMMDVELMGIEPIYSEAADQVRTSMDTRGVGGPPGGAAAMRTDAAYWTNYLLAERYLDLFALFAIGYKQDNNWKIASESVPALVNSFNWVNRSPAFQCSSDSTLPIRVNALRTHDIWDVKPGWERIAGDAGRTDFFAESDSALADEMASWDDDLGFLSAMSGGKKESADPCFGRGGRLFRSNMGVNIPIMQVISNDGTTDLNISEFAGFTSSILPDDITTGHSINNPRTFTAHGIGEMTFRFGWASPVGGREILKGLRVHYGNSKLSAIKIVK